MRMHRAPHSPAGVAGVCALAVLALTWCDAGAQYGHELFLSTPSDSLAQTLIDSTSITNIEATVQRLQDFVSRYVVVDSCWAAGYWIRDKFLEYGYTDVRLDTFRTPTFQDSVDAMNVLAYKEGTVRPSEYVILGGHYDSVTFQNCSDPDAPAPGAGDNATGVAGVLEAARLLRSVPTERSIVFACWSAEEVGTRGSWHFVTEALAESLDIVIYLNIDCIGYNDYEDPDGIVHTDSSSVAVAAYIADLAAQYTGYNLLTAYQVHGPSDHDSFWKAGYSAVDTGIDPWSPYNHTPDDLIDHVDLHFNRALAAINVVATAAIAGVAGDDTNLPPETYLVENCASTHSTLTLIPRFEWQGIDFDGDIAGYEYSLWQPDPARTGRGHPYASALDPHRVHDPESTRVGRQITDEATPPSGRLTAGRQWTLLPASQTSIALRDLPPDDYEFAVRAIDNDGAKDPSPAAHRFATRDTLRPTLTVETNFLPQPRVYVNRWTAQDGIPVGVFASESLAFRIDSSAECYCGIADSVSYSAGDTLCWSPWEISPCDFTRRPSIADSVLYFRTRDENGAVTIGKMVFDVVDAPMHLPLLHVDDWLDASVPAEEYDAFYRALLYGHEHDRWDPLDHAGPAGPELPPMEELGRYKTILWSVDRAGGLLRDVREESGYHCLEGYVRAGGNLVLEGHSPLSAFVDLGPYSDELTSEPGEFVYDYVGIDSMKNAGSLNFPGNPPWHGYAFLGAISVGVPGYIDLPVDTLVKWAENYAVYGGVPQCEIVRPTEETSRLYLFDAYLNYTLDERPCATLHFGRESAGSFALFGFPFYYLETTPTMWMMDRLLADIDEWAKPADLVFFESAGEADSVELRWYLYPPEWVVGCDVERKTGPPDSGGDYTTLNDQPVTPGASGRFRFVDRQVDPLTTYSYRLDAVERSGAHTLHGPWEVTTRLGRFAAAFSRAYPNPSSNRFYFEYGIDTDHRPLCVRVYDLAGRLVTELLNQPSTAGVYPIEWDATDSGGNRVANGVYFVRAQIGYSFFERKVVVIR